MNALRPALVLACCLALAACKTPKKHAGGGGQPVPAPFEGESRGGGGAPANGRTDLKIVTITNVITEVHQSEKPGEDPLGPLPPVFLSVQGMTNLTPSSATNVASGTLTNAPMSSMGSQPGIASSNSTASIQRQESGNSNRGPAVVKNSAPGAESNSDDYPAHRIRNNDSRAAPSIPLSIVGASNRVAARATSSLPLPVPASTQPEPRTQASSLNVPIGAGDSIGAARNDRSSRALKIPTASQAGGQAASSPRLPLNDARTEEGRSSGARLRIWDGIGDGVHPSTTNARSANTVELAGGRRASSEPAAAIVFDVGAGTNGPTSATAQPIAVDPLLGKSGVTNWRDEQLAKQNEQQKVREQERSRLRRILYEWLMLSGHDRAN